MRSLVVVVVVMTGAVAVAGCTRPDAQASWTAALDRLEGPVVLEVRSHSGAVVASAAVRDGVAHPRVGELDGHQAGDVLRVEGVALGGVGGFDVRSVTGPLRARRARWDGGALVVEGARIEATGVLTVRVGAAALVLVPAGP